MKYYGEEQRLFPIKKYHNGRRFKLNTFDIESAINGYFKNPPKKGDLAIRRCKSLWCYCDGICEGCSNGYFSSTTGTDLNYNGESTYTTHT